MLKYILILMPFISLYAQYPSIHQNIDEYHMVGFKNQMTNMVNNNINGNSISDSTTITEFVDRTSTDKICSDSWKTVRFFVPPGATVRFQSGFAPNTGYQINYKLRAGDIDYSNAIEVGQISTYDLYRDSTVLVGVQDVNTIAFAPATLENTYPTGMWVYFSYAIAWRVVGGETSLDSYRVNMAYVIEVNDMAKLRAWVNDSSNFSPNGDPYDLGPDGNKVNAISTKFQLCDGSTVTRSIDIDGAVAGVQTCYHDNDKDGYGAGSSFQSTCTADNESTNNTDCDDTKININPGKTEVAGNLTDENCDNRVLCYQDKDNDNYSTSLTILSTDMDCSDNGEFLTLTNPVDCNDNSPSINPGATDIPNDGTDQDCSGADLIKCYVDSDGDGEGNSNGTLADFVSGCPTASGLSDNKNDCDDSNPTIKSSATELAGNEVDENCDEKILCYVDGDNDDFSINQTLVSSNKSCGDSGESITLSAPIDCNDASPSINPSKPQDTLVNGISQNCDNLYACYKDEDNDDIGTNEIVLSTSAACNEAGMTYNLYNGAGFDNCPTMDNPDQKDSNGNDIGDVCDRPFTSLLSSSDSDVGTLGSYEKILEEGDGHITFNKDITFSNDNFKRLERIYIPPSALEATIVFTNKSGISENYTEIYSKFGAVSNYIDLYSPFQRDSKQDVNLRTIIYDRQDGNITIDDYEDLLAMDITTRVSGKSISYTFSTEMLKRYVQHGEWLYFIIKQTEGLLNISYDVNVNLQSDIEKYNFDIWADGIKDGNSTDDGAAHIVVRKDADTVDDYIFDEDEFNSSKEYMSIHDIRATNGHRGLKAHAESAKLTNYIKHTYHALIDQKKGVGTNKFKAYIPKNSSVNLYIATKPIDGDIAVKISDGASEVFNGTMKNHRSYKIENTGSTARWLKIDMARIGNQNLGVIFEYTAKYSSRPADLDGIKGDPQ